MKPKRHTVQIDGDGFIVLGCFGADACPQRALDAPDLPQRVFDAVAALAPGEARRADGKPTGKAHNVIKINISFCPNACARSQIADVGCIAACAPKTSLSDCEACGTCAEACREDAVKLDGAGALARIDFSRCMQCGACIKACPTDALREGETGFRLMLGGKLGRHPRFAEELSGLRDPDELPALVARCVGNYLRLAQGNERMGDVVSRVGAAALAQEDTP